AVSPRSSRGIHAPCCLPPDGPISAPPESPAPKAPRRVVCAASTSAHCLPDICLSRPCGAADGAPWGARFWAGCRPCAVERPTADDGPLYRAHHVRVSVQPREIPASPAAQPRGRAVDRRRAVDRPPFPTRALTPALAARALAPVSAARASASAVSASSA